MAWQRFSVQSKQEDVVWEALLQHLMAMKRELHDHNTVSAWQASDMGWGA